ncbi:hypothetical protein Syun_029696 [Stephania yunnanensis]|uniref:MATH domain-containing protein n=1 Tax=Stephania yunnanensis TaxID=152371 RepID=A0AAP0EAJ3_9MAGN
MALANQGEGRKPKPTSCTWKDARRSSRGHKPPEDRGPTGDNLQGKSCHTGVKDWVRGRLQEGRKMSGIVSEDNGIGRSSDGISSGQRCQSGEALAEWRSSEQVENGTPSTSPPYWDTDDDDDCGHFRRSGRYILIYPQGCDVCNHLSLFLCVANHDKLLPGWSHFAQFTIAVVNKDPKKSKYSDTLHRFWKKEHDWGWKKFMELSKVLDGFIVSDTLVIKAQVQVIRFDWLSSSLTEQALSTLLHFFSSTLATVAASFGLPLMAERAPIVTIGERDRERDGETCKLQQSTLMEKSNRPFRCLDCQYRRELVRVYLTNVEQICRRFVEERRGKLGKFIEDKVRWSSFCAFWLGVDQNASRRMSREKTDAILKVVVKHFFIEKEVTSTLVMDSLYSGLKALEGQGKSKKGRAKLLDCEEMPAPIVCVDNDMFVLADDVLPLLERAAVEPLPPKDEKGPQNRTKDGSSGEDFNKDSIERDERRLTELGRRTVEIFVLAHIFSNKIEVAYKEAVALKKQEELIREEEASGLAENEHKGKRGTSEKERRTKKKQNKKRGNRKGKDNGKDEKFDTVVEEKRSCEGDIIGDASEGFLTSQVVVALDKPDTLADESDVSCIDDAAELSRPDLEDRDASPVNWDTDTSEVHPATEASNSGVNELPVQNGQAEKKSSSCMDDSSSSCSSDSVPSAVMNGTYKGNSLPNYRSQASPCRGKSQCGKERGEWTGSIPHVDGQPSDPLADAGRLHDSSGACRAEGLEQDAIADRVNWLEHQLVEKDVVTMQKKLIMKDSINAETSSSRGSPPRNFGSSVQLKPVAEMAEPCPTNETSPSRARDMENANPSRLPSPQISGVSKCDVSNSATTKMTFRSAENPITHKVAAVSRPSSAPLIPGPRRSAPVISMPQAMPILARSVSAAGRLGTTDALPTTHSSQSYRNAIMGKTVGTSQFGLTPCSSSVGVSSSSTYMHHPSEVGSSLSFSPQSSAVNDKDMANGRSGFTFGSVTPEILQNQPEWVGSSQSDASNMLLNLSLSNGISNINFYGYSSANTGQRKYLDEATSVAARQAQGVSPDEFPHLDIINYLLDEEHSIGKAAKASTVLRPNNGHHYQNSMSRPFSFPGDLTVPLDSSSSGSRYDRLEGYHDNGIHQLYESPSRHFDPLRDTIPMGGLSAYGNGQIGGLMHNQWQGGGDISSLRMSSEGDGYLYQIQPSSGAFQAIINLLGSVLWWFIIHGVSLLGYKRIFQPAADGTKIRLDLRHPNATNSKVNATNSKVNATVKV